MSAEPSLDLLAPLLDEAELPKQALKSVLDPQSPVFYGFSPDFMQVGEVQPLLVSPHVPLKLANIFTNVSFQHFWGSVATSCGNKTAGARLLMRNATLATSKARLQKVLGLLRYAPEQAPVTPPAQTWMVQPCKRGRRWAKVVVSGGCEALAACRRPRTWRPSSRRPRRCCRTTRRSCRPPRRRES